MFLVVAVGAAFGLTMFMSYLGGLAIKQQMDEIATRHPFTIE